MSAPSSGARARRLTFYVSPHETSWVPAVLGALARDAPGSGQDRGEACDSAFGAGVDPSTFVPAAACADDAAIDFAWVHTRNADDKAALERARVRGGCALSGAQVLEDKFNLALLSASRGLGELECHALVGARQVEAWCEARYGCQRSDGDAARDKLWMVKDSGANCGDGLWVTSGHNWANVVRQLHDAERSARRTIRFVVQEYLAAPELWDGSFKYHVRMYLVLRGDLSAFLHSSALIHVANKPFETAPASLADQQIHLTNVSKNHHNTDLFHGCPVVDLASHFGAAKLDKVKAMFASVFCAAAPYMAHQVAASDFSHIGADVMFDQAGNPHLLECNIPPCIGNYNSAMAQDQHDFFHGLFGSMVQRFVIPELVPACSGLGASEPASSGTCAPGSSGAVPTGGVAAPGWLEVCGPRAGFEPCRPGSAGLNHLAWKLFERKAVLSQAVARAAAVEASSRD